MIAYKIQITFWQTILEYMIADACAIFHEDLIFFMVLIFLALQSYADDTRGYLCKLFDKTGNMKSVIFNQKQFDIIKYAGKQK